MSNKETFKNSFLEKYNFLEYLFFFIRVLFYRKSEGIGMVYLLYFFIPQKIFRINGFVQWPVHFTSRILFRKNIKVGRRSAPGMNSGGYVQAKNGIEIGNNLRMGPNVGLISANHDEDDYDSWVKTNPIKIGNNVWLGMGVVVLPGITIGDNVIVAANSVVNKDLPSNVIAGGAPCKILKDKDAYKGKKY
jgi:acetyltransferase-like isoleucine patch superfamily enzyme